MNEIKIIDDFLENWRKIAFDFYMEQYKEYKKLNKNYREICEKESKEGTYFNMAHKPCPWSPTPHYNKNQIDKLTEIEKECYELCQRFYKSHNKTTWNIIIHECGKYGNLNKILNREVVTKKTNLIARVEKKAGKIIDASLLKIGIDGNLNGIVKGSTKTVNVTTIYAGGYNIQCLHYRILVK